MGRGGSHAHVDKLGVFHQLIYNFSSYHTEISIIQ